MVGSVAVGTIAMVLYTAFQEISERMQSTAIDSFLDLVGTIFFTILNVIAAGAESVQSGFMIGLYVGITLSVLYLFTKWLTISKGWQLTPAGRRAP
jgi:uncharacterized membrane protein